jgi:hypothetical protein
MPPQDGQQKDHTPKFTPSHSSYASTERFEREVGKFGGTLADLPKHLERIHAAGGAQ